MPLMWCFPMLCPKCRFCRLSSCKCRLCKLLCIAKAGNGEKKYLKLNRNKYLQLICLYKRHVSRKIQFQFQVFHCNCFIPLLYALSLQESPLLSLTTYPLKSSTVILTLPSLLPRLPSFIHKFIRQMACCFPLSLTI